MDDYTQKLNLKISSKTYSAMLGFLKKHNKTAQDIPRFIEDALVWRILNRQLAFLGAEDKNDVDVFLNESEEQEDHHRGVA